MDVFVTRRQFADKTKQKLERESLLHEFPPKIKFYIIKEVAHILVGS